MAIVLGCHVPCVQEDNQCRFRLVRMTPCPVNNLMYEPIVRLPVTCPQCGIETIRVFRVAEIASALIEGRKIKLFSHCHARSWDASDVEQAQIREYLAAMEHPGARSIASEALGRILQSI